jgi:hypothetical protein
MVMYCLIWAGLFGLFCATTGNQYEGGPYGDASYFADMTQVLYLGAPPVLTYPAIHSRRVLGPWVAGKWCRLADFVHGRQPGPPAHFNYLGNPGGWPAENAPTFGRILAGWRVVNVAGFFAIGFGLVGILRHFQSGQGTSFWQAVWLAVILGCAPTLGRLYIAWPFMNDLAGIGLGLLSLFCLLRGRVVLSGVLFGLGMLARENLALVYPCFFGVAWTLEKAGPKKGLPSRASLVHLVLSFTPYLLICLFPLFTNIRPFLDVGGKIHETETGALNDYIALITYHLERPFTADHAALRQAVVYWQVCGPLLLLVLRFYPWSRRQLIEDGPVWCGLAICAASSFFVDRYVVYNVFPLLLLARHCLGGKLSGGLAAGLTLCYLMAVRFFAAANSGDGFQVEFMDAQALRHTAWWGAGALLLTVFEPLVRRRLAPFFRK